MRIPKKIAFDFVLEQLDRLRPIARPMFGCHGVYVGEKIVLITRDKGIGDGDEGVWVSTQSEHHASLRREIPSLRSLTIWGNVETRWQIIPKDSLSFEEDVIHVCELILRNDPRIGSVPKRGKGGVTRKR